MNKRPGFRKRLALELYRSIKKKRAKIHDLHTLYWQCTLRCNQTCCHCGNSCRTATDVPDMPLTDFLKIIDELTPHVNPAQTQIQLTGGEPLLRTDIETCGLELTRRGYPWGITTNGQLLTHQRLKSLLAAGMHTVAISIDGFKEAHNWLRDDSDSFQQTINAISLLAEEKEVEWLVNTIVYPRNLDELPLFKDFLIEMDVKNWHISTAYPIADATLPTELELNDQQYTWVLNFIRQCRKQSRLHVSYGCEGFLGNYEAEVRDQLFQCTAGINTASIQADGSITGCHTLGTNHCEGSIYTDRFTDVWQHRFAPYRNRQWAHQGSCATCDMFRYCEGGGMHLHDNNGVLLTCHYKRILSF